MKKNLMSFRIAAVMSLLLSAASVFADGMPNVSVTLLRNKLHRAGVTVMMDFLFTNNSNKEVSIWLDANPFENHQNVIADGEIYSLSGVGNSYNFNVPAGETVKRTLYVDDLPYNVKSFDSIKLKGRSSAAETKSNPYGDFFCTFTDVKIPAFPNSNRSKCYFLDTEFGMTVDKVLTNGKDLAVVCTLTNNGKRNKRIASSSTGTAADDEGDEYEVEDPKKYLFTDIPSGESAQCKVIVKDGANRNLKKIRIMYDVQEISNDNLSYHVLLQLDNVLAPE